MRKAVEEAYSASSREWTGFEPEELETQEAQRIARQHIVSQT